MQVIALVSNGYRPDQDYERMPTWINILGRNEFIFANGLRSIKIENNIFKHD